MLSIIFLFCVCFSLKDIKNILASILFESLQVLWRTKYILSKYVEAGKAEVIKADASKTKPISSYVTEDGSLVCEVTSELRLGRANSLYI